MNKDAMSRLTELGFTVDQDAIGVRESGKDTVVTHYHVGRNGGRVSFSDISQVEGFAKVAELHESLRELPLWEWRIKWDTEVSELGDIAINAWVEDQKLCSYKIAGTLTLDDFILSGGMEVEGNCAVPAPPYGYLPSSVVADVAYLLCEPVFYHAGLAKSGEFRISVTPTDIISAYPTSAPPITQEDLKYYPDDATIAQVDWAHAEVLWKTAEELREETPLAAGVVELKVIDTPYDDILEDPESEVDEWDDQELEDAVIRYMQSLPDTPGLFGHTSIYALKHEIAEEMGADSDVVLRALRRLKRKGLVQSYRGPHFWYWRLNKAPKTASVMDVSIPPSPTRDWVVELDFSESEGPEKLPVNHEEFLALGFSPEEIPSYEIRHTGALSINGYQFTPYVIYTAGESGELGSPIVGMYPRIASYMYTDSGKTLGEEILGVLSRMAEGDLTQAQEQVMFKSAPGVNVKDLALFEKLSEES